MRNRKKTTKAIFALALSLLMLAGSYGPARAQDAAMQPDSAATPMGGGMMPCPMMRGGMVQGHMEGGGMMSMMVRRMMSDPVKRSVMQVYMLPALQGALTLSEDQAARMKEEKQQFVQQRAEIQEGLRATEEQLREALNADQPDLEQVQALLAGRATLEAEVQAAAVETTMQMQAVLSEEQREELAALEPMAMHRAMMAGLSMQEMMGMMQTMGGSCPTMDGMRGMMRGGMMQDDQMEPDGEMQQEDLNEEPPGTR